MPIYEYVCRTCNTEFEKLLLRRGDEVRCPQCDGTDLERKLSGFGFASKGSSGEVVKSSSKSGCSSCSGTSCSTCR